MNLSFWESRYINNSDICVIGAGLVGLISAIELRLKYPNAKIIIAERGFIGTGASTKNAGFACFGSIGEIKDDIDNRTEEECIDLISKRWVGLNRLRALFHDDQEIGLEFNGSYEIFTNEETEKANSLSNNLEYFNNIVDQAIGEQDVFAVQENPFPFHIYPNVICNRLEGQLDVSELIHSLHKLCAKNDIHILNGFSLDSYIEKDNIALEFSNGISLETSKLVFATNAFTKKFFPELDLIPYRNQLVITEPIDDLDWKGTFHYNSGLGYFRNVGKRILIGGRRDLDMEREQTTDFGITDLIQDHLVEFLQNTLKVEPNVRMENRWSGILAHGDTKAPILRKISENVLCAVRLGGMGIAIASNTAKELADLV